MNEWLTDTLKTKIRTIFEPRYKRKLTNEEVAEISENLTAVIEEQLKLKWRQKHEESI